LALRFRHMNAPFDKGPSVPRAKALLGLFPAGAPCHLAPMPAKG